jgi:hypothetical protein
MTLSVVVTSINRIALLNLFFDAYSLSEQGNGVVIESPTRACDSLVLDALNESISQQPQNARPLVSISNHSALDVARGTSLSRPRTWSSRTMTPCWMKARTTSPAPNQYSMILTRLWSVTNDGRSTHCKASMLALSAQSLPRSRGRTFSSEATMLQNLELTREYYESTSRKWLLYLNRGEAGRFRLKSRSETSPCVSPMSGYVNG